MPLFSNFYHFLFSSALILGIFIWPKPLIAEHTPITTYYIRYDIKSSNHRITDENFLMIPAENEFRMENFSQIALPCVISMTPGESKTDTLQRAKKEALKRILNEKGLQSVKTKNGVTIISYEGVIVTPIRISQIPDNKPTLFSYIAHFKYSPMAFPDRWQGLKIRAAIKEKLHNFLQLFH